MQKGFAVVIIIVVIALLATSAVVFISKNPNLLDSLNMKSQKLSSSPTGTELKTNQSIVLSPTPISTNMTPKPTIKATLSPPVTNFDLSINNSFSKITRSYDKGDGNGAITDTIFYYGQTASYEEIYWTGVIQICGKIKPNQAISGGKVTVNLIVNGSESGQTTLSFLGNLNANSEYEFCRDATATVGKHNVTIEINKGKNPTESSYSNNSLSVNYEVRQDQTPPSFTFSNAIQAAEGTCLWPNDINDNINPYSDLKIEYRFDSNNWSTFTHPRSCINGNQGDAHTYSVKITDKRGNVKEQSKTFNIL